MRYMSPHEMPLYGATVGGSVDPDFDPNTLCNGDPHDPVFNAGGLSLSAAGPISVAGVTGAALINHSLATGQAATLSGSVSTTLIGPRVPPGGIRLNPWAAFGPVTAQNVSVSTGASWIGELVVGVWRTIRSLPPGSEFRMLPFMTPNPGEFIGVADNKGGESRVYGGTIYLDDAQKEAMDDWWRASANNSLPSIIVPFENQQDAMAVIWQTYAPSPFETRLSSEVAWRVSATWQEITRFD
jgi:hypothetical protein